MISLTSSCRPGGGGAAPAPPVAPAAPAAPGYINPYAPPATQPQMSQQQLMSAMGIGGMVSQGMNPATQGMNPMRPLPTGFQGPGMMGAGMMGAGSMPMMPGQMRPLPPGLPPAAGGMMGGGMMGAGLMPGLAQAMAPPPMPTGFTEGMLQARHFGIYCVVDSVCVCVCARARASVFCACFSRVCPFAGGNPIRPGAVDCTFYTKTGKPVLNTSCTMDVSYTSEDTVGSLFRPDEPSFRNEGSPDQLPLCASCTYPAIVANNGRVGALRISFVAYSTIHSLINERVFKHLCQQRGARIPDVSARACICARNAHKCTHARTHAHTHTHTHAHADTMHTHKNARTRTHERTHAPGRVCLKW